MIDRDEQDKKIVAFLEKKTIERVNGSFLAGSIEIVFTDETRIELEAFQSYDQALIQYTIAGVEI